jgi:Icc protein
VRRGDFVFDAIAVDRTRAHMLGDLFKQTSSSLHVPVHYTLGNRDVFGITPKSGVAPGDPEYGKKAYQDRYGPTYYSFDTKAGILWRWIR